MPLKGSGASIGKVAIVAKGEADKSKRAEHVTRKIVLNVIITGIIRAHSKKVSNRRRVSYRKHDLLQGSEVNDRDWPLRQGVNFSVRMRDFRKGPRRLNDW